MKSKSPSLESVTTETLDRVAGGCRPVATYIPKFNPKSTCCVVEDAPPMPESSTVLSATSLDSLKLGDLIADLGVGEVGVGSIDLDDAVSLVNDSLDIKPGDDSGAGVDGADDCAPPMFCGTTLPGNWEDVETQEDTLDANIEPALEVQEPAQPASDLQLPVVGISEQADMREVRDHRTVLETAQPITRDHR